MIKNIFCCFYLFLYINTTLTTIINIIIFSYFRLVDGISSLTAIYFQTPETFVKLIRDSKNQRWEEMEEGEGEEAAGDQA